MADNYTHDIVTENLYRALTGLMDRKPYSDISITEIVREAGTSRMAFYRNYRSKDDILLSRLARRMNRYVDRCTGLEKLTEKAIWIEFFSEMLRDPLMRYLRQANLMDETVRLHKQAAGAVYRKLFRWDLEDKKNMMLLYQRIGSMLGLLLYLVDFPQEADPEELADYMLSMVSQEGIGAKAAIANCMVSLERNNCREKPDKRVGRKLCNDCAE